MFDKLKRARRRKQSAAARTKRKATKKVVAMKKKPEGKETLQEKRARLYKELGIDPNSGSGSSSTGYGS